MLPSSIDLKMNTVHLCFRYSWHCPPKVSGNPEADYNPKHLYWTTWSPTLSYVQTFVHADLLDIPLPFVHLSCEPTHPLLYWLIQTHPSGCPSRHSLLKTRAGTSPELSIASFLCQCACHRPHHCRLAWQTWISSCWEPDEFWLCIAYFSIYDV